MDSMKLEIFVREGLSDGALSHLCREFWLVPSGAPEAKIERILSLNATWEDISRVLAIEELKEAAERFGLPVTDDRPAILAALQQYLTELSEAVVEPLPEVEASPAPEALDPSPVDLSFEAGPVRAPSLAPLVTHDNVRRILRSVRLPPSLTVVEILDHLAQLLSVQLGDVVRREVAIRDYTFARIGIDIDGRLGVEVSRVEELMQVSEGSAPQLERLLGRVIIARGQYAPGTLFVLLHGQPEPSQYAMLNEAQRIIREHGGEVIRLIT